MAIFRKINLMPGRIATYVASSALLIAIAACNQGGNEKRQPDTRKSTEKATPALSIMEMPPIDSDSAYAYVRKQVSFGPRVPNTEPHRNCARWLTQRLNDFGASVETQKAKVTAYNGKQLNIVNIMGRYNMKAPERLLLCAHWDTRPYADRDSQNRNKPIAGANDGASGVAVLLEVARVIGNHPAQFENIGVDIVFFDAEDYGKPEASMIGQSNDSWCLGSQYWCRNMPWADYKPRFGILLDMVGAKDAVFPKEGVSMYYAPAVVNKIWSLARQMGYGEYFVPYEGSQITDDHLYLNQLANIPTVDIIHYEMSRLDFGAFHHTHDDNLSIIDPQTLQVVGDVVLQVIGHENQPHEQTQ
ncbi:MAG: M28 family peptidase [Salibacteraceae bacterium]